MKTKSGSSVHPTRFSKSSLLSKMMTVNSAWVTETFWEPLPHTTTENFNQMIRSRVISTHTETESLSCWSAQMLMVIKPLVSLNSSSLLPWSKCHTLLLTKNLKNMEERWTLKLSLKCWPIIEKTRTSEKASKTKLVTSNPDRFRRGTKISWRRMPWSLRRCSVRKRQSQDTISITGKIDLEKVWCTTSSIRHALAWCAIKITWNRNPFAEKISWDHSWFPYLTISSNFIKIDCRKWIRLKDTFPFMSIVFSILCWIKLTTSKTTSSPWNTSLRSNSPISLEIKKRTIITPNRRTSKSRTKPSAIFSNFLISMEMVPLITRKFLGSLRANNVFHKGGQSVMMPLNLLRIMLLRYGDHSELSLGFE